MMMREPVQSTTYHRQIFANNHCRPTFNDFSTCHAEVQQDSTRTRRILSPQGPFFPHNPSLEMELERLFANFRIPKTDGRVKEIRKEFKINGKDLDYNPEPEISSITYNPDHEARSVTSLSPPPHSSKFDKKKVERKSRNSANECALCKKNNEDSRIYTGHVLKDATGKVVCPILRKLVCKICGAHGDRAHTLSYCPFNKGPAAVASMNSLKSLRNSTGRRQSK